MNLSMRRRLCAVCAVLPAFAAAAGAAAEAEYIAVDISRAVVAGTNAFERAKYPRRNSINQWGDVVGTASTGTNDDEVVGASRPFLYFKSRGTVTNTGDLEGDEGFEVQDSVSAYAINNLGWVAGGSGTFSYSRPFVWVDADLDGIRGDGEMYELDLNDGDTRGSAQAVNDAGQVLIGGNAFLCRATFRYEGGTLEEIGPRTVLAEAFANNFAMNENGDACWTVSSADRGYRWIDRNGDGVAQESEIAVIRSPWGAPDGDASASGINDAGHVVGTAKNRLAKRRGFLWIDGNGNDVAEFEEMEDLAPDRYLERYIYPMAVNNHDVVVGGAALGSDRFAFIWDRVHGMRDLNDLFTLEDPEKGVARARQAWAINDYGQIAVEAYFSNRGTTSYALLLTPAPRIGSIAGDAGRIDLGVLRQTLAATVTVERAAAPGAAGPWDAVGGWITEGASTNWTDVLSGESAFFYRLRSEDYPEARQP